MKCSPSTLVLIFIALIFVEIGIGLTGTSFMYIAAKNSKVFYDEIVFDATQYVPHMLEVGLICFHVSWLTYHVIMFKREGSAERYDRILPMILPLLSTGFMLLTYSTFGIWYLVVHDVTQLFMLKMLTSVMMFVIFVVLSLRVNSFVESLKQQEQSEATKSDVAILKI